MLTATFISLMYFQVFRPLCSRLLLVKQRKQLHVYMYFNLFRKEKKIIEKIF